MADLTPERIKELRYFGAKAGGVSGDEWRTLLDAAEEREAFRQAEQIEKRMRLATEAECVGLRAELDTLGEAIFRARRELWWFIERDTGEGWGFAESDTDEIAAQAMMIQDEILGAALGRERGSDSGRNPASAACGGNEKVGRDR